MKTAIIIHGAYGNSDENWFPWLKTELEKIGYNVYVPNFPTPENQNLKSWLGIMSNLYQHIDSQTILIGHSVGVAFILSVLELLNSPIKAIFLVSGFLGLLDNKEFDDLNKEFTVKKFDWDKIESNVPKIFLYHSDNDSYVPINKAYELGEKLKVEPVVVNNAGHFNSKSGYNDFPQLLSDIKNLDIS